MWRPHVQIQAVLAYSRIRIPNVDTLEILDHSVLHLVAAVGQLGSVQNAVPVFNRHGPLKSQIVDRLFRIGYAEPGVHSVLFAAERIIAWLHVARYVVISVEGLATYASILRVYD